ncbi:DUF192 domain-containing protein [Novosphingobium sp. ERN07]|uniref:DUF192 domain-containing protein n=1 Tax=Novosphingobium sp. ERN07 TaxID=2726187 RepID=UPI001456F89D|nr:DUF192 domain-containing protein [Novosphingobium sp. ERN07]NLR72681.1 DUF192 domain-containing protein [Novosphingobium sp. ERN07]
MKQAIRTLALAALALMAGCSPGAADAGTKAPAATAVTPSVHPISGLKVGPVTITTGGKARVFKAEYARTSAEQAKGLMFRTRLADDEGMIFLRNPPDRASFWMRNTVIPLDLIFVGLDRRIINIAANAVPYDETPLISGGPTLAVFEINGGLAAKLGIQPGDKVDW